MDVEDAMTLSYEDFCARYMAPNRPVLLRNVTDAWFSKARQWRDGRKINFKYLKEHYGAALAPNGTAGKKYLKDWHFVHAFGHDVYVCWDHKEKSESDYRFVYLGPAGSWTPLHQDVFRSYSWSVNVCGRKKWVFYHPDDRWYHQVENLEDTISINHNWFNGYNVRELWDFFKKEYAAVECELEDLKEMGLVGREFVDQCQLVMRANTGINYLEFRELLYAKARELLEKREHPEDNSLAVAGSDLLTHLRYVRDILQELNAALKTVDEDAKFSVYFRKCALCFAGTCLHSCVVATLAISMALKTPEEEIAELRQANDELYREHANEKAQMQAAVEQERLRTAELTQTVEAITEENGQWRESYAALDEAKRYAEEQIEETRRYAEEQFAAEKAELEEQIAQLEESVKNCTSQMVDDLAELERLRASDASHEQQQAELQRQLDERDDRFAQLSAEYDTLRVQYDQLQQAQYDAQKTHEDALAAKQQDLTSSGNKVEDLQTQVASLESQLKAASADEDVREANQSALLRRAEQKIQEKQEQLDEVNARVKGLEDELALLSLTGPGGNDYTARIRGLQQEVFVKSEQLVQQGEKHLRVAGLFDKTKSELVQLREEVGNSNTGMDDSLYQHVKLEELVRLRLKAFEHEWQLAGGPTPSSSTLDPATDEGQDSAESSSCHLANVENFSALDALGLGGVGRLEREMRVLRSRNKRLIERTERLESELDSAQAGLRDLQSMREKMVEMVGRERVEKELRAKSEQTNKELGEKVAALSEHAQRRVDKELLETRDKLASATRKNAAQDAKVAELEQGARILEDQLRLMDEKFIDVRNKLDWTRSSARKENKQLSAELRSLRMKWQMESDAGALSGLPDWAPPASVPKFSKKAPLGTSSSESRLPTPKASNNGLSPVVAAVVQDALAIGNGARVKFDIPKLPQPESDAVHVALVWHNLRLIPNGLADKSDTKPGSLMLCRLLVTVAVLLPPNSALSSPRDRGPLFNGSVVVRSLDVKGYEAILADSESVWVVDYYSSWCAHCRMFAPKWEKVGEFYHESKVVQVGAVDCNQHKDVCQREEVHAYPSVKAHHAKPVVEWVEKLLAEHGIESGMDISTIVEETKLRRNDVDEEGGVLNDDTSIQMKYKRLRDAGKAAMLALENSFFIGTPVLEGERYAAALKWVNALADTFPVEGNRVAVAKLVDRVKTQRSWPLAEWNELIEKWRPTARETSFLAICSIHGETKTPNGRGGIGSQRFIWTTRGGGVAWKMHNSVNKRLHRDQWPSTSSCPSCYIDIGGPVSIGMSLIHEDGMVTYVTSVYGHEDEALFDEIIMAVHGSHIYVPSGFFSAITGVTLFFALLAVVLKTQRHRFVTSKESGHMA
ncbi:Thioredoxin, conserved site [Phytophthora cactorum]|nr:Thioredoxin, conserved site [Phytophthora cactorum]